MREARGAYALTPDGWVCVLTHADRVIAGTYDQWVKILDGPEAGVHRWYSPRNLRRLEAETKSVGEE
jgi:hypothetical protein